MKRFLSNIPAFLIIAACSTCLNSCNTKDETTAIEDDLFFVEFTVGEDTVRYEDGENNYGNGPGTDSYRDSIGRLHSQFTTFIRNALAPNYEDDVLTIQMVKFFSDTGLPDYNTDFLMFDEGVYPYGSWNGDSTALGIDGAVLTYTDNDGKVWESDRVFGQQEGDATFEITSHKAVDENLFGGQDQRHVQLPRV